VTSTVSPPRPSWSEIGAKAQGILRGPAYEFCHDPKYPWTDSEAHWCSVVGASNERCEALPRACQGEMTHAVTGGRRNRGWGQGHEDDKPFTLHMPSVGPIFSVVLWVVLGVGIVFLLRSILLAALRRGNPSTVGEVRTDAPSVGALSESSVVESDVQRLLDRARRAAAEGRFGDGIADAYAALLRQLEGERLLRIDPWRTNGDYLRDLGRRPDVRNEVSLVVRGVEGVQFGREAPTAERYELVYRQVSVLLAASASRSARGRGALGVAAIACLALGLTSCSGMFGYLVEEDSPSGTSAVVELMRQSGLEPTMRLRSLSSHIEADQIVLLADARLEAKSWKDLLEWVDDGGTLIVANQDAWLANWPGLQFAAHASSRTQLTVAAGAPAEILGASVVVPGTSELVIPKEVDSWTTLLERDGSVYAARFEHGDGSLIALADGQLFTNASIAMADNAAFLVAMLGSDQKKVDLVGELTGGGSKSPLASVERGKLAPVLLQLGLALMLFFLYKGVAFGTLIDPPSAKRRTFADHARALGLLYAKARASGYARSVYGAYALERLRDSLALRDKKGISALADVVAARSGLPIGQVTMMLVLAQEPRSIDSHDDKGSAEDLDLIRRLTRLLGQSKGVSK
jgi:hypothetical protein